MQRSISVIAHNMRSIHNVGSLLRTGEGLGIEHVYLTGYTPYPEIAHDNRLPHIAKKLTQQINKTALGAESTQSWSHRQNINALLDSLKNNGVSVVALEQTPQSIPIVDFKPPEKLVIILGREVEGLEEAVISQCDSTVVIPMFGKKESFNVVQAAAMALFYCKFYK